MKIEIVKGPNRGEEFDFAGVREMTLGRAPDCDIRVGDDECSRHHARIARSGSQWIVEDLGSTNGIYVNGSKTRTATVKHGTQVALGMTTLLVSFPEDLSTQHSRDVTISDSHSEVLTSLPRDAADLISARGAAQERSELERENRALRRFCEIARVLATAKEPHEALTSMLMRVMETVEADTVFLLVKGEQPDEWATRA